MAKLVPKHRWNFYVIQSRRPPLFISKELETIGVVPLIDQDRVTTQNRGKGERLWHGQRFTLPYCLGHEEWSALCYYYTLRIKRKTNKAHRSPSFDPFIGCVDLGIVKVNQDYRRLMLGLTDMPQLESSLTWEGVTYLGSNR